MYFEAATNYYVLGRFAVFAAVAPTAGNVFHHAVEMGLKGLLCEHLDEPERRRLGHSLRRVWRWFKRYADDPTLQKFDRIIVALDRFEEIRYPERSARLGMVVRFAVPKPPPDFAPVQRGRPTYEFNLQEIDELLAVLFEKANLNPAAFSASLRAPGREFLAKDNAASIWQSPS
jgi:hypothetical protein